jgi:hypothetical protein
MWGIVQFLKQILNSQEIWSLLRAVNCGTTYLFLKPQVILLNILDFMFIPKKILEFENPGIGFSLLYF